MIIIILVVIIAVLLFLNRDTIWENDTPIAPQSVRFTPRPSPSPTPTEASSNNNRRPDNCSQARAWGLTAREAGRWSHLDRDGDGVACYGD